MKKRLCIALVGLMMLGVAACGKDTVPAPQTDASVSDSALFGTFNGKDYLDGWTVGDFMAVGFDTGGNSHDFVLSKYNMPQDENDLYENWYLGEKNEDGNYEGSLELYAKPDNYAVLEDIPVMSYEVQAPCKDIDINWNGLTLCVSSPEDVIKTYGEPDSKYVVEEKDHYVYKYNVDDYELTFICSTAHTGTETPTLSCVRCYTPEYLALESSETEPDSDAKEEEN